MSIKKNLFSFLIIAFILYSCFFPAITLEASKKGLLLWFEQVLPALLPFSILSSLLLSSNFFESFAKSANLLAIIFTMVGGFLFGFPIGAKLSSDFYERNLLTEKQALVLAITANNFSPMYICGFALPTLFTEKELDTRPFIIMTYIFAYLIPLILTLLFLILDTCNTPPLETASLHISQKKKSFHLCVNTLDNSIIHGFISLIKICGYILFFSILCNILMAHCPLENSFFLWILENLEITNGIALLATSNMDISYRYLLGLQLLSLGGLSGFMQTASMICPTGLSIYKYIIGKVILSLLISFFAAIYVL